METDLIALKRYAYEMQVLIGRLIGADHDLNRCMQLIDNRNYGADYSDETYYAIRDIYMDLFREALNAESDELALLTSCPLHYFL